MCMNRFYGNLIRSSIGKVLDVNVKLDDTRWGNFLKVRIEVPLDKALASGRTITVKGESCWIPFKMKSFLGFAFIVAESITQRIANLVRRNLTQHIMAHG